jgi:hypothetical protein
MGRWRVMFETLGVVVVVVVAKYASHYLGIEFVEVNTLMSSIIGGAIFLFGLILAGTLTDFKESERMPSEMVAACASIAEDGRHCRSLYPDYDLPRLLTGVRAVLAAIRTDLMDRDSRTALGAIDAMTPSFAEMEALGLPANYIVRLKGEQGVLRRAMQRIYYIQRIDFLPSAYNFVRSLVVLIILILLVTLLEPFVQGLLLVGFITYLLVYILRLLHQLDQPFRVRETTRDDVSLFQMHELEARLDAEIAGM